MKTWGILPKGVWSSLCFLQFWKCHTVYAKPCAALPLWKDHLLPFSLQEVPAYSQILIYTPRTDACIRGLIVFNAVY
jgi:hypothetical protein